MLEDDLPTTIKELTINGETKQYEVTILSNDAETLSAVISMGIMTLSDNDPFVQLGINDWIENREEDLPVYFYESPDGLLSIEFDDYSKVDIFIDETQPTSVWLFNSSVEGMLRIEGHGGLFNTHLDCQRAILRDSFLFNQDQLPDTDLLINTTMVFLGERNRTVDIKTKIEEE
ncbi:hypothetical protein [Vibrio phage phiKT1028]|nr:hypothetical protein [Vibrio phage phiKT1028]